ncbi:hypothetical protein ACTVZO_33530 [Streptomyces sp. IBSNAI002]|uniref:hypothetical protein n=1 Tax=Streptomyces sp. IBSNAI002 TaxID=3457500 RepID=UPI003FD00FA1
MRPRIAATAFAGLLFASTGAPGAAAAPTAVPNSYCTYYFVAAPVCYDTFRELIREATDYEIQDAPLVAPPGGPAATATLRAAMESVSRSYSGMHFSEPDYTGDVLLVWNGGCRARGDKRLLPDLSTWAGGKFNDRLNSQIGMNGCQIGLAEDPDYGGSRQAALPFGQQPAGNTLHGKMTSAAYYYSPTTLDVTADCGNGNADCTYTAETRALGKSSPKLVADVNNCTSIEQQQNITWTKSIETSTTVGGEAGTQVSVEAGFGDSFKVGVALTLKATWGKSISESTSFSQTALLKVSARNKGLLYLSPPIETFTGTAAAVYKGSGIVVKVPYTVTHAVETEAAGTTFNSRPLTAAELASPVDCPTGSSALTAELVRRA